MAEKNIPTPKNIKESDDFYKNAPSGQKMAYEPPAELVEIPSHGYLYKSVTEDQEILDKGALRIRPMTVNEEKILATTRLLKSGQALDMIFRNVIKSKINPTNLLASDRMFIMLWLRASSYGNVYKFNLICPNKIECGRRFEFEVNLNDHPIKEFTDENIKEPFEFTLPMSENKLVFRLPRGEDEIEILKLQNQPKKMDDTDESIVKRMVSIVFKIISKDGTELEDNMKEPFLNSMLGGDASAFRNELEELDCGPEDIKNIICPHCEFEYDTPIPVTENFFRFTK